MKNMIDKLSDGKPEMALIILLQNAKSFQEELSKFNEIRSHLRKESVDQYLDKLGDIKKTLDSMKEVKKITIAQNDLKVVETLIINLIRDLGQIFNEDVNDIYIKDLKKILDIIGV